MAFLSADFGNGGLTGVGYVFKDIDGADIGTRITAGISEIEAGVYSINTTVSGDAWSIYWDDSANTGGYAIADVDERIKDLNDLASGDVDGALINYDALVPADLPANFSSLGISAGGVIDADAVAISGDTTAADNLEAMFDGSGYTDPTAPSSRAQVSAIGASSGGSLNFEISGDNTGGAIKGISFVGSQTNTYTAVEATDGSYHTIDDTANEIDIVYSTNVGGSRTAVELTFKGYLDGNNDSLNVLVYDHDGASWDAISTIAGQAGTENITVTVPLLSKHTGSGADLGDVYVRFQNTAQSNPQLNVDSLIIAAVYNNATIGYQFGAVWIDTNASNTNAESYVDGTADNPVSTLAAAKTLASNLNLASYHTLPGSAITLTSATTNEEYIGHNWSLELGGQDISGSYFYQSTNVSGTATCTNGDSFILQECQIGTSSLSSYGFIDKSALATTLTITSTAGVTADSIIFSDCFSSVPGSGSPHIDFSNVTKTTQANFRRWSGGIELTLTSDCTVSVDVVSGGNVTVNGTGGTLKVRGMVEGIIDNSSGAVDFVISSPNIDQTNRGTAQGGTENSITLASSASTMDGAYDPGEVLIVSGPGKGEKRAILDYEGSSRIATVGKDWRVTPTSSSSYIVFGKATELHVNEGKVYGGTSTTMTLNESASSTDDIYIGQTIFVAGGTGQDQSRIVTDYNGTTRIATVHKEWDITPTSGASYVMLPLPTLGDRVESVYDTLTGMDSRIGIPSGESLSYESWYTTGNLGGGGGDATEAKQDAIISLIGTPSGIDIATELWHTTGQINSLNNLSAADVNAEVDTALIDYDGITRTEATSDKDEILGSIGTGYTEPSDATLAKQNEIINLIGDPSGLDIATELWTLTGDSDILKNRLTSSRAGYLDNLNIGGDVASSSEISNLNNLSALEVGQINTGALNDYDAPTRAEAGADKAEIGALISGLNDLSSVEVDELLTGYGLDHIISTSVSAADVADDSIVALLASKETPADFSSYTNSSNSLEAIADIIGGLGSGSGAYLVTVTVTDGTNPVPNATVRVTEGVTSAASTTDANGNAEFSLDAASHIVTITKAGYSFAPEVRTVTGTETGTLTDDLVMAIVAIPNAPTDASLTAVYGYFEEGQGRPVANLPVNFDLYVPDTGSAKSDKILGQYTISVKTDISGRLVNDSGYNFVYLQRNDLMTPTGTYWRVTSADARFTGDMMRLTSGTYDLAELIV